MPNRTYSRCGAFASGGRKPFGTFNSAPQLAGLATSKSSKGSLLKASAASKEKDKREADFDSLASSAKSGPTLKKPTQTKKKTKASVFDSPSLFSSDDSNNADSTSSPTPVFLGADKDDTFDRLMAGPSKTVEKKANYDYYSSDSFHSAESSVEKSKGGGGLFASFGKENLSSDNSFGATTTTKKKTNAKKPPARKNKPKISSDRHFSDETLNYATKRIGNLHLDQFEERSQKDESKSSDDVFESPLPSKFSNSDLLSVSIVNNSKKSLSSPAKSPKFLSPKLSIETNRFHSPAAMQQMVTSTPQIGGGQKSVPTIRISDVDKPSAQGLFLASPLGSEEHQFQQPAPFVTRKGGKNWRRSVAVGDLADRRQTAAPALGRNRQSSGLIKSSLPSGRRQTAHCKIAPNNLSFDEIVEEEQDEKEDLEAEEKGDKVPTLPSRSFLNMTTTVSAMSTSYIVPTTMAKKQQEVKDAGEAPSVLVQPETTDLEKVLSRCSQQRIVPFDQLYSPDRLRCAFKVGEGTFGEVFLLPNDVDDNPPVVKIVPVDGSVEVNEQPQTKLGDMLAEITISTELSRLTEGVGRTKLKSSQAPCFLKVNSCNLTEGLYPAELLEKWDDYNNDKGSENDRPDEAHFAGQDAPQKFVVLELNNGGKDLEDLVLSNAGQGLAIFNQVAHALGIAEQLFQFEHRDLHWGNILVRETSEKLVTFDHGGRRFDVDSMGVIATIIDFSLSRMTLPRDGCEIFNNLAEDEELFQSQGDYQFDIYRMMREETKDNWRGYHPKTNVFWLDYLLDKLLNEVQYKSKKSKVHRSAVSKMRQIRSGFLDTYSSAFDYIVVLHSDNR